MALNPSYIEKHNPEKSTQGNTFQGLKFHALQNLKIRKKQKKKEKNSWRNSRLHFRTLRESNVLAKEFIFRSSWTGELFDSRWMRNRDKSIGKIPNSALFEISSDCFYYFAPSVSLLLVGEEWGSEARCGSRGPGMPSWGLEGAGEFVACGD